jgi:hypothetical protein
LSRCQNERCELRPFLLYSHVRARRLRQGRNRAMSLPGSLIIEDGFLMQLLPTRAPLVTRCGPQQLTKCTNAARRAMAA